MLILVVPLAVVLLVVGWLFLVAGRQGPAAEPSTTGSAPFEPAGLPGGRLASRMTQGLDRTARAVDVLVDPRPSEETLRSRPVPPEERRTTYAVLGGGLLGLAVVLVAGLVLVVTG